MVRSALGVGAIALLAPLSGCAAANRGATLDAYAHALRNGQFETAYGLLTAEIRREVSLQTFREVYRSKGRVEEAASLIAGRGEVARESVSLTTDDGATVRLKLEGGKWYVDPATLELYPQDTPRHTIESFIRAVEHQRFPVLVRFASEAHRSGLDAKTVESMFGGPLAKEWHYAILALRAALATNRFEGTNEHASLAYARGTFSLVREGDEWKIDSFE